MKFAYTRVRKGLSTANAVISFFFNARGDMLEKSTTGMYRSLLLQLLERFPDLKKVCEDSNLATRNGSCPSSEEIQSLFQETISNLGERSLTCFIDALDECDELQVRDMVEYFETLGQQAIDDKVNLRICFSSRHYPYIFIRKGIRLTLEDHKGHGEDVERYIQGNLRAEPGPLANEVQAQILQKAAGVFMWVVLVVDILNKEFARGRMFAVKKRLAEIPDRLSDLFKDILKRDNENMEDLLLCLQWILYAKRPLMRQEFYFAVSTGLLGDDEDYFNDLMISIPDDIMDRFVVNSSKGLAEVTKSNSHTVQFIHESVRDFLIKDNGLQELWPEFGDGFESLCHDKLKRCCYKYLELGTTHFMDENVSSKGNEEMKDFRASVSKRAPFLRYATQNVLYHADIAASSMLQDSFLAAFKLKDWIVLSNLFEKYKVRRYSATACLFYILADKGFSALIQTQLRLDSNYCTLGERYRYPIFAAMMNGNVAAVQALQRKDALSAGEASWRSGDIRYRSICKDKKKFLWAINNGYKPIVEWFIENGADVNIKNRDSRPPLIIAVEKGHASTSELLVARGADVAFKDIYRFHQTALFIAIEKNYNTIAAMLIERGADINIKDDHGRTPLIHAIEWRNNNAIQLLLEKGADINTKGLQNQSLLMLAIEHGNTIDAIQLLIERGADINEQDGSGWTLLLDSMKEGRDKNIIQLLIENGADVNPNSDGGMAPLIHAIDQKIDRDIIQLLIEKGANVNSKSPNGRTPLIYAVVRGSDEDIIRLLIEKGADINVEDFEGQTALKMAFQMGNYPITAFLIEKGADSSSIGVGGTTIEERLAAFTRLQVEYLFVTDEDGVSDFAFDKSFV